MNEQTIALLGGAVLLLIVAVKLLFVWRKSASAGESADGSEAPAPASAAAPIADAVRSGDGWQALVEIPGVEERQAQALAAAGIGDMAALRDCGQSDERLHALADTLGLEDFVLTRWIGTADLLQVSGMSPELADALVRTGVRSRAALADANPDRVQNKLMAAASRTEPPGPSPDRAAVVALIASAGEGQPVSG